ncbi:MAG TPA: penicillin-binding transpeptidase domain-containing protein [Polyangiales bacterium]|nr:penicillin-binding transpeptidase domain-containing protein [Polyangiales bacterium]
MRDLMSQSWLWGLASLALVLGTPLALTASPPSAQRTSTNVARVVTPPFSDVDLGRARQEQDEWVVPRRDGTRAVLTVDDALQSHIRDLFNRYEVPAGALVAIEPKSGRVLAYVGYEAAKGDSPGVVTDPGPPAASVFKIITASALLDAGVSSSTSVCYGGGMRNLVQADLVDDPKRDRWCHTLADALGYSINAIFAKLADRHINGDRMARYVSAFGFGQRLPFDLPTDPSPADVPDSRLERARMAAGFWHSQLSPLHGALLASTIANDGKMPYAAVVDRIETRGGETLYEHTPRTFRQVLPRHTARAAGEMMTRTVTHGTSKKAFWDPKGRPFLPGIEVAGKTGTLSRYEPHRTYNWWVGYAPVDDPQIAVAALVVNEPKWRIKASYVAREALRSYLMR